MPAYPELFVIRHGQTEWNRAHRHQGRLDSPLTEQGQAQARAVGRLIAPQLDAHDDLGLFTSPQGRARATAELALAGTGRAALADDRLSEVAFGAWEGLCHDDLLADYPGMEQVIETEGFNWHFLSPGGETLDDLQTRAGAFLNGLQGPAVLFTHGVLSRVLRGLWLGLDDLEMQALAGGQGVVFHLHPDTGHRVLPANNPPPPADRA